MANKISNTLNLTTIKLTCLIHLMYCSIRNLILIISILILSFDTITKTCVVNFLKPNHAVPFIGNILIWKLVRNSGAAFSLADKYTCTITLVAIILLAGIVCISCRTISLWWKIGCGMIIGGASGNLVDRLFRSPGPLFGYVVDFFSIGQWPVFNVADQALIVGSAIFMFLTFLDSKSNKVKWGNNKTLNQNNKQKIELISHSYNKYKNFYISLLSLGLRYSSLFSQSVETS